MKNIATSGIVGLALLCLAVPLAPALGGEFAKSPNAALVNLKGARGKPVKSGLVFINGEFLPPPYVVMRSGTVITVNKRQVTDEIVPWNSFVQCQAAGGAAAPAAPKSEPAKQIDDLFSDTPAPAAKTAPVVPEAKLDGAYQNNARQQALLKRINDYRTDVDRRLRAGQILFFGAEYPLVPLDPKASKQMLGLLPEAMRDSETAAELNAKLRAAGFTYVPRGVADDLLAHRLDYLKLVERRNKIKEDAELDRLLNGASH